MAKDSPKSRSLWEREEKINEEKIEVVRENEESTGRDYDQGCIEVRVIQLRPTMRETQNHLDFQSKIKLKQKETFLAWGREPRNWKL